MVVTRPYLPLILAVGAFYYGKGLGDALGGLLAAADQSSPTGVGPEQRGAPKRSSAGDS